MRSIKGFVYLTIIAFVLSWATAGMARDIVIGYSGPLGGPAAEYGMDCVNGIDMAIKEINAAGGITVRGENYRFKLVKLDDQMDPTRAANNARRLAQDKAVAVFNPIFTTMAAIMKINQDPGNPFIVMGYTSTPQAHQMGNKLFVNSASSFTIYTHVFGEKARQMGWRKIAMLVTLGAYGDDWRRTFKAAWEKKGGIITADKPANYYKETDFSAPLTAVLKTKPNAILIGGPSAATALVIEQARNMGFKGGFILIDQAKMDQIASILKGTKLMENVIGTATVRDIPAPAARPFNNKYSGIYRRMGTWEVALNYCGMHALSKAIVAANTTTDIKAIRAAFPRALPILGDKFPAEMHGISSTGHMHVMGAVQIIRKGAFTTPALYDWWSKTQDEFNQTKRLTRHTAPVLWFKTAE